MGFDQDFADNPKYSTNKARVENRNELIEIIQEKYGLLVCSEWMVSNQSLLARLTRNIPQGKINSKFFGIRGLCLDSIGKAFGFDLINISRNQVLIKDLFLIFFTKIFKKVSN
jgi:hypothetical protein